MLTRKRNIPFFIYLLIHKVQKTLHGHCPGGDSPIKTTGVLVRKFEEPLKIKVPASQSVGVAQINSHPLAVPGVLIRRNQV